MSFVMLTESQVVQAQNARHDDTPETPTKSRSSTTTTQPVQKAETLSHKMETTARLFEIMSARSDIDHPICIECTELLVDGLQKRLTSATKERDAYVEFLRQANADIPTDEEVQQAEADLKDSLRTEEESFAELQRLEKEKAALDDELLALEAESLELDKEEDAFWAQRNNFAVSLASFQSERDRLNARYDHDTEQLKRLQRTNVFNDIFNIGHDGYHGTINNLRLGRATDKPAEWAEINAALGQTCLLLVTVADKLGYTFQGLELKPLGSTSSIYRLESSQAGTSNDPTHPTKVKKTEFPLYNTGDLTFGFVGFHGKFDQAMIYLLECVRQLGEYVSKTSMQSVDGKVASPLTLPYEIRKDKINGASVKQGFGQDAEWTKACKYMLTCCKFLLAHASSVSGPTKKGT